MILTYVSWTEHVKVSKSAFLPCFTAGQEVSVEAQQLLHCVLTF